MSTCRGCRRRIAWLTTANDAQMPVDANAGGAPIGRVIVQDGANDVGLDQRTRRLVYGTMLAPGAEGPEVERLRASGHGDLVRFVCVPHWSTCPQADAFHKHPDRGAAKPQPAPAAEPVRRSPPVQTQGRLF